MTKHPEPRSRPLFFALGFSLLLHALLLVTGGPDTGRAPACALGSGAVGVRPSA